MLDRLELTSIVMNTVGRTVAIQKLTTGIVRILAVAPRLYMAHFVGNRKSLNPQKT